MFWKNKISELLKNPSSKFKNRVGSRGHRTISPKYATALS